MSIYSPRVDFAFKKLFASDLLSLKALINAILPENEHVTEVTLLNSFNDQSFENDKLSVLDIKALDASGRHYNIEMQVTDEVYYSQRALYYWSKLYSSQLKKGENYNKLRKTISIHVLNFNCFEKETHYHNVFHLLNAKSRRRDFEDMELHFIELQKFTKNFDELTTPLDHWTSFLASADRYDKKTMPIQLKNDPNVRRAMDALEHLSFTDEEREIYEAQLKWLRDVGGAIAQREAVAELKKSIEEQAKSIEEKKKSIEEQAKSIEEQAKSIEEKKKSIEGQAKSIEEKKKSIEEQAKSIEEKKKSIEEQVKSIEEQAKSIEEKEKGIEKKLETLEEREKGIEKKQKELEEGIEKGRTSEKLVMARNAVRAGLATSVITQLTGLSIKQIEKLNEIVEVE